VTTKEGFPILGEVEDGNLDDKSWNKNLLENLAENFTPEILKDMIYVADSALVTNTNLSLIEKRKIKFISRLPSTFNLVSELIEKAFSSGDWEEYSSNDNKASYRLKEFEAEIFDRRYRLVVVCPLTPDKRKLKGFESRLRKEKEKLEKGIEELSKIDFACEADAREALFRFSKENQNSIYKIKGDVEACFKKQKRNKRGRPSKDEETQYKPVYHVKARLEEPDEETLEMGKRRMSSFVLITNIFDGYNARSILREYKEQTVVENRFRFIKNPLYVGPLFVKKNQRLEALSYVVLIALLIYMVIQIRVRRALKEEKEPLELAGKVKSFEPTGSRVLELILSIAGLN
jgi:transposase